MISLVSSMHDAELRVSRQVHYLNPSAPKRSHKLETMPKEPQVVPSVEF